MKHIKTATNGSDRSRYAILGILVLPLVLATCTSSNNGVDKRNPPTGGTPAEFGFQYAQAIAKNGNCDQALPILICLGEQGTGWELATHSSGVCALEAAKLWTGPLQVRAGFFSKTSKVSYNKPYYQSKAALNAKGMALLHLSAAAGWPDSQAVLVRTLSGPGHNAADLREAKLWITRYDQNPRRKIYGSNSINKDIRSKLTDIAPPAPSDQEWEKKTLPKITSQDPFCKSVIRTGFLRPQHAPLNNEAEPSEDGLPEPETVDRPGRRSHQ
ncbi:MAG: hypothetical protein COA85_06580 [Robiginitomaculum sp.]|nr:MAG: hypothetical protein COA85_06580 [Robiginitomaculum sp.]